MYDLYWSTLGGGEQVDGSIAQVLAADHDVTLLGPHPADVGATFAGSASTCRPADTVVSSTTSKASEASADFDVFVNGTYLSKAINRASLGYYYVHFPGEVPTASRSRPQPCRRRRREGAVARAAVAAPAHRGTGGVRPPGHPQRIRPDVHPLPGQLRVHRRLDPHALERPDRRAVPAGPAVACGPATRST